MFRCNELGCDEKFTDEREFAAHTSYHVYHQKIKELGEHELQLLEKRFNSDMMCPLADRIEGCYYFPQLPTKLVCQWYDCNYKFLSVQTFYEHVSSHAHKMVDKCYWANCTKSMKKITPQLLREHLRVHTLQKLYACPYCGNFFSTKIKFNDHFLRHFPMPDYLQNRLLNPSRLTLKEGEIKFIIEEYDLKGSNVKIFRCAFENCDKAFFSSSLLREHIRVHSNKNQCDQCLYRAQSWSRLESHKKYRHSDERDYQCTICMKTFKQRGDLRAHVRRHQIVEPYKCDRCDFETLTVEGLNTHLKSHDKNHDYCCHLCPRVFGRGNNLSRHLKHQHKLVLPDGQSRFKYKLIDEGVYLLDTGENSSTSN